MEGPNSFHLIFAGITTGDELTSRPCGAESSIKMTRRMYVDNIEAHLQSKDSKTFKSKGNKLKIAFWTYQKIVGSEIDFKNAKKTLLMKKA